MILNSCVHGGGAGQSLAMLLDTPDTRIDPYVVLPEPGVMAPRFSRARRLIYVPEFVERIRRSPYVWPDRLGLRWLHGFLNIYALPRAVVKLVTLVRELQPQVIYCNHMLAKPLGVLTGTITGTPVVLHSRSAHHLKIDSAFYSWLGARRLVKRIIANSRAAAEAYSSRCADKLVLIPNGLDPAVFNRANVTPRLRQQLGLSANALVVGYLGRLHPKKGVDWLIRSFAELTQRIDGAQLVIVGDTDASLYHDPKDEYRQLADSLLVGESVHFLGFQEDVRPYLADFDMLVFPSRLPESFGRVLLEAMAFEIPVVTSAHGGAIEVVQDGVEGLCVPVEDVDALAQAMIRLGESDELRRSMGHAGRTRVEAKYAAKVIANQIWEELVTVAQADTPSPGLHETHTSIPSE